MQHEPEDTDPTTQREPDDDVEAHNWAWASRPSSMTWRRTS